MGFQVRSFDRNVLSKGTCSSSCRNTHYHEKNNSVREKQQKDSRSLARTMNELIKQIRKQIKNVTLTLFTHIREVLQVAQATASETTIPYLMNCLPPKFGASDCFPAAGVLFAFTVAGRLIQRGVTPAYLLYYTCW